MEREAALQHHDGRDGQAGGWQSAAAAVGTTETTDLGLTDPLKCLADTWLIFGCKYQKDNLRAPRWQGEPLG